MTTTETPFRDVAESTYRALRERHPARIALSIARADLAAERAGLSRWHYGEETATIDGKEYAVTIEPDPEGWQYGDDDVTGRLVERSRHWYTDYPDPVEAPMVALDERRAYDPGPAYDPDAHLAVLRRKGWAKGPSVVERRRQMLREAERYEREADYGDPRNWIITVDRDGDCESLGGVELLGDGLTDRSYVWEAVQDLANEVECRRTYEAARRTYEAARRTCHA